MFKATFTLYFIDTPFDASTTVFENIVGTEEIACNEQFLLFPQCFLINQKIVSPFVYIFDIISSFAAEIKEPKIGISGKGLTAKVISWQSVTHTFPSLLTLLSFQSHRLLFSHALAEAKIHRKESSPQPHIEFTTTRSCSPLSHPVGQTKIEHYSLSEATNYFSHNYALAEAKIRRKESFPSTAY